MEASSIKERIRSIILEFRHKSPNIHLNYSLVTLLYLRKYCLGEEEDLENLLTKAAQWELPSMTSLCRLMTIVKKEFETPEEAEEAERREEEWTVLMRTEGK